MAKGFPDDRPLDASPLGRLLYALAPDDLDTETNRGGPLLAWYRSGAVPDHATIQQWARLLWAYDGGGYAGPPCPPRPSCALSHTALLLLYESRAGAGENVRHPADLNPRNVPFGGSTLDLPEDDAEAEAPIDLRTTWLDPGSDAEAVLTAYRSAVARWHPPLRFPR